MRYRVDSMSLRDGVLVIEGWCIPDQSKKIEYSVVSISGKPMKYKAVSRERADVAAQFGADMMSGFNVTLPFERDDDAYLVMRDGRHTKKIRINHRIVEKRHSTKARRIDKLLDLVNLETLTVSFDFIKENGFRAFVKKAIHKIQKIDVDYDYPEWQLKTAPSEGEINRQRTAWKEFKFKDGKPPLISIVIPAYNTAEKYLSMLFDSILAQTYPNFEVIVADGSDKGNESVAGTTSRYSATDPRFKLVSIGANLGISGNTNKGLEAAKGDYVALCDHDDELPAWALYEVAKAISENPEAEFIYTDEDKIDSDGGALFEPHFKSDMNLGLLCSVNYICHLSVIRKDLLSKAGGFRQEYDGAQDHDFFLRCLEEATGRERALLDKAFYEGEDYLKGKLSEASIVKLREGRFVSEKVIHIPVICYHWRYHKGSTSSNPSTKLYAFEAGKKAVAAHYERLGIKYSKVEDGVTYGYYHTTYDLRETGEPLVSVIIPNKDHIEDLDKCIRSIAERSEYRNLEFIVVENNSGLKETFDYYANGIKELEKDGISIKVVRWEREFNYSAINNFGTGFASGDLYLFLNNDVELISPSSITEMVSLASRAEVGMVGAKLTYGDNTIQHAGVIVGLGGIAGAAFVGLHEKENSYMHRMMCTQELSAVTAACVMMRREVFEKAGGFREELAVAFNDIDLCMKVRALGKLIVYNPYSTFHHYESKSRGLEDTPEKVRRFNNEIAVFAHYWGGILEAGDPYYNANLTLRKSNFALRDLTKEKPGEPFKLELDVEKQLEAVLKEKQRRLHLEKY